MLKNISLHALIQPIVATTFVLIFSVLSQAEIASPNQPATIVLIIDDMGNGLASGRRALALPGEINYAFLPHSPNSRKLAEEAHQQGKEVLLHAPMSNVLGLTTGPGTLSPKMDQQQFLQTLQHNLQAIPHVKGVNNHMGSLLTQLNQPMNWLMSELKQRNLYFIDSRTSPLTVAESQAHSQQLPTRRRDIFLDNDLQPAAIAEQFERLVARARLQGIAVAIGHPHPETLTFLEQALPDLADRNIQLALASSTLESAECNPSGNNCHHRLSLAKGDNLLTEDTNELSRKHQIN